MTRAEALKERTAAFAVSAVKLCRALPATPESRRIGGQLIDAATSSAANYRAACRARSRAEFIAKIGTVVEEIDETAFWLDLLVRTEIAAASSLQSLRDEAEELTAIFVASLRTAKSRSPRPGGTAGPR